MFSRSKVYSAERLHVSLKNLSVARWRKWKPYHPTGTHGPIPWLQVNRTNAARVEVDNFFTAGVGTVTYWVPSDTTNIFHEIIFWKIWDVFLGPCLPRLNGCWNRKKMFNFFQDLSQVEQKPMKIGDLALRNGFLRLKNQGEDVRWCKENMSKHFLFSKDWWCFGESWVMSSTVVTS